jgi:hypothetical protein
VYDAFDSMRSGCGSQGAGSGGVEDGCALSLTIEGDAETQCVWSPSQVSAVIVQVTADDISMPGFDIGTFHLWVGANWQTSGNGIIPCSGGVNGFCYSGGGPDAPTTGPVFGIPAWFRFRVIDAVPGVDASHDGASWTTLGPVDFGQSAMVVAQVGCGSTHCGGSVNMTLGQGIFVCPVGP